MAVKRRTILRLSFATFVFLFTLALGVALLTALFGPRIDTTEIEWSEIHSSWPFSLPWWTLRPNLQGYVFEGRVGEYMRMTVSTNSDGLRGESVRDESRASRILCLGDSTTFGLGVNDDDTWPHQLQMILGAHRKDVQVLNAGVSGYSSLQGLAALRDTGVLFAPQLVIVTFGYNDQSTSWKGHYDIQAASDGFLLTLLKKLWEEEGSPQSPRLTPGQYFDTMREIADVCAAHGAKCLFVAWPSKTELDPPQTARIIESQAAAPYEPSSYYHLVPFIAALSGAAWIDLYPHVKDAHPLIDMVHYNADGNRRVAQAIADLVTSQELFLRESEEGASHAGN